MSIKDLDIDDVPVVNKLPIIIGTIMIIISLILIYYNITELHLSDECCGALTFMPGVLGIMFIITGFRKRLKQFKRIKEK